MIKAERRTIEIDGSTGLVMAEFNKLTQAMVLKIGEDRARMAFEDGVAEAKGQTAPTMQKLDESIDKAIDKALDELLKAIFSGGDDGSCD